MPSTLSSYPTYRVQHERPVGRTAGGGVWRLGCDARQRRAAAVSRPRDRQRTQLGSALAELSGPVRRRSAPLVSQYKTPDVLAGRRVLVVGGGNSGFDIATESARHAPATFHSVRRGYPLLPRYFRGRPVDRRRRVDAAVAVAALAAAAVDCPRLPARPGRELSRRRRTMRSSKRIRRSTPAGRIDVARGAIVVKPDIRELQGREVLFDDGTRESVDVIIYATGFNISFPFLDAEQLNWHGGRPELFLNVFHPERDDLFVAGLIQPDSGQFGLVDCQAQLIAAYLLGLKENRRSRDATAKVLSGSRSTLPRMASITSIHRVTCSKWSTSVIDARSNYGRAA